jgi:uncharacterized protein
MTRLDLRTEPVVGTEGARGMGVLFLSDWHLGWPWTRSLARELVRVARAARPHAIALGGDFVDHRHAVPTLERTVRLLARVAPTCAIAGNHDHAVERSTRRRVVREACIAGGATWLEDEPLRIGDLTLAWSGDLPVAQPRETVVCVAHAPSEVPAGCHFRAAVAGHLHGGQAILFTRAGRHFPGVLLSRWCGDRFETSAGPLIVGRGCGDSLPLRLRCPKEAVLLRFE